MSGYGTDEGFEAWLAANGLALPVGALDKEVLRLRGSVYLDGVYGSRLACSVPTGGIDQERAWPRTGHFVGGDVIGPTAIPLKWIQAAYRAAYLIATNPAFGSATVNPMQRVKRQKVDTIEREFFDGGEAKAGSGGFAAIDAEIDGLVAGLLCPDVSGEFAGLWAIGS
jgi:hypothetical protein